MKTQPPCSIVPGSRIFISWHLGQCKSFANKPPTRSQDKSFSWNNVVKLCEHGQENSATALLNFCGGIFFNRFVCGKSGILSGQFYKDENESTQENWGIICQSAFPWRKFLLILIYSITFFMNSTFISFHIISGLE